MCICIQLIVCVLCFFCFFGCSLVIFNAGIHFGDIPIWRSGSTILANISQLESFLIYFLFWLFKWRIFFWVFMFNFIFSLLSALLDRTLTLTMLFYTVFSVYLWNAIASFKSAFCFHIHFYSMITMLTGFDDNTRIVRILQQNQFRFLFFPSFAFTSSPSCNYCTSCLLLVFQLNNSIGITIKLSDLICLCVCVGACVGFNSSHEIFRRFHNLCTV